MKKIVIDARESGTSTGRYIDMLIEYLHVIKPALDIVVLTKAHRVEHFNKVAPKFTIIKSRYKEFGFGEQLGLAWQLCRLKADLVHFGMVHQPVLYTRKSVTTIHDLTTTRFRNPTKNRFIFWIKQQVYKWVIRVSLRKAAHVITPTQFVKDDVAKFAHINSRKITVTYESADIFNQKPEAIPGLEDKEFIMFNGRPLPHKNLRRLIKAFVAVREKYPDLLLVIIGKKDGSYRSYTALVKQLRLEDSVIFTDFVPDGQLRWAMEHTKAYVYPSLSEGFGLPGLEAMLYGAPLISSNATCLPEVYGDAAEYIDPYSEEDIAKKIMKVLASEKRRKELVATGKKQVKKYSWKKMAEQTVMVYQDVLAQK